MLALLPFLPALNEGSTRCAQAFVETRLTEDVDILQSPDSSNKGSSVESCANHCDLSFTASGTCDLFFIHRSDINQCNLYSTWINGQLNGPTTAAHVFALGSDPGYAPYPHTSGALIGQPIFDGATRCPLQEGECTNFAVGGCSYIKTTPSFVHAEVFGPHSYDECLSECADNQLNTYMLFRNVKESSGAVSCDLLGGPPNCSPPSPPPSPLQHCYCFVSLQFIANSVKQ